MAPKFDNSFEFSYRTRQRDWDQLKNSSDQIQNIVIAGGGIVGAGLLRELSLSGVEKCFLFERNDYASATSGVSSKLIHAGIRYLELAWDRLRKFQLAEAWVNFKFVYQASRERKILGQLAPGLVKPKKIYLIIGQKNSRATVSVYLGVWLYYLMQLIQGQFFSPPSFFVNKKNHSENISSN